MKKISVIVPIYNVELYVEKCIDSIINQTYSNLDILLVNDGSKDNSGWICDKYGKKDSRVKVFHTENKGLSAARNHGIRNSSGDYIMFVDGDDFITSNCIKDIVEIINEYEDVDIISGKMIKYYDDHKQIEDNFQFNKHKINNRNGIEVLKYFFEEIPCIMWSACRSIYRKQFIIDNDMFFREGITSEDLDIIPRVYIYASKVAAYDDPFYYYRQLRPNSIVNTVNPKRFFDIISIINRYLLMIECNQYPKAFKKAFFQQLANIYARYVAIIGKVPKSDRKEVVNEMKKIKHILIYAKGFRGKYIAIFTRFFGFNITCLIYSIIRELKIFIYKALSR